MPFTYQIRRTMGPRSAESLFVEGQRYNMLRLYRVQRFDPNNLPRMFTPDVPFDPFNMPSLIVATGWTGPMPADLTTATQRPGHSVAANPAQMAALFRHQTAVPPGSLDPDHTQPRLAHRDGHYSGSASRHGNQHRVPGGASRPADAAPRHSEHRSGQRRHSRTE